MDIQQQLQRNNTIADRITLSCAVVFSVAFISALAWFVWHVWPSWTFLASNPSHFIATALIAAFVLIAVSIVMRVGAWAMHQLALRYLPSFVIDDSDASVVKLHGSIGLTDITFASKRMLASRPNFKMYRGNDTYEKFGCTLAAVPMTDEDARALIQHEEIGFGKLDRHAL